MTEEAQTVLQLPTKSSIALTDKFVFVSNAANGGNVALVSAQTVAQAYGYAGSVGYTGSIGYTGSQGAVGYTGSVPGSGIDTTFTAGGNTFIVTNGIITGVT